MSEKRNTIFEKGFYDRDVISDRVRDYVNEPYFVKKTEKAKEFLRQHPIPERYLKK